MYIDVHSNIHLITSSVGMKKLSSKLMGSIEASFKSMYVCALYVCDYSHLCDSVLTVGM